MELFRYVQACIMGQMSNPKGSFRMSVANAAMASQAQLGSTQGRRMILAILILVGYGLVLLATSWFMLGSMFLEPPMTIRISASLLLIAFAICLVSMLQIARVSIWNMEAQVLPVWMTLTIVMAALILMMRLPYSTIFAGINWASGLVLLYVFSRLVRGYAGLRIGVLDGLEMDAESPLHVLLPVKQGQAVPAGLDAVIASTEQIKQSETIAMLSDLAIKRVPVIPDHIYREQVTGRVQLDRVDAAVLIQLQDYQRYAVIKRASDILMAAAGLILLLPVMIVLALLIRLESPGHPIFVQVRTGLSDREFRMYKFRSMVSGADSSGAQFASQKDNRITGIGRVIRKLRLDELPQLYNVLIGDMSMIGPRPEQKALIDDLSRAIPLFRFRHMVRPGITGWAQVSQGYADDVSSSDVKLSYDLFYIKNLSPMMDFIVFFKTLKTIMTGFGSR